MMSDDSAAPPLEGGSMWHSLRWPLVAVALLLATNGPLFVCMPLTNDTAMYDLQTRILLDGGTLYRDVLEPNLPGVVWLHAAVRALFGFGSEVLRLVDLVLFGCVLGLLYFCLRASRGSARRAGWLVVVGLFYYLSISEWNHCQRDPWLLLPALLGFTLRRRQVERLSNGADGRTALAFGFAEGVCWGAGVWLKPMVMIPAIAVWLTSLFLMRTATVSVKRRTIDFAGLLLGGLAVGAAGMSWLVASGTWPHLATVLRDWNPHYFQAGKEHWTAFRFATMTIRFTPWIFLHLLAIPLAIARLWPRKNPTADPSLGPRVLFAALYLGWFVQAFFLQHLFDYVHAPLILLAMALMAGEIPVRASGTVWKVAIAGFLGVAMLASPALRPARLAWWGECVQRGSTPEVRAALAHGTFPDWKDLEVVEQHLASFKLRDGQLTCYNNCLIYLYLDLDLKPSTRFAYMEAVHIYFPERVDLIREALLASPQEYVVTDLHAIGVPEAVIQRGRDSNEQELPPEVPERLRKYFPWMCPVVFRAGSICVHRVPPQLRARAPDVRHLRTGLAKPSAP